ncbi:MAG: hypothetical protein PHS49_00795 [Candidatus Gracilibacteria bacterium]|nr:hypothetical protein [Candidatus Gracilibacteria bacterium]
MIKNNLGESLIGIVVGVFILSFIILGITNLLINSKTIVESYEDRKVLNLIKNNTENVIKNIDTSAIKETEIFYLYKDSTNKEFLVFTGTVNAGYKYIDQYGNKVDDLAGFSSDIYARTLWIERDDNSIGDTHQIIKVSVKKLIKK